MIQNIHRIYDDVATLPLLEYSGLYIGRCYFNVLSLQNVYDITATF